MTGLGSAKVAIIARWNIQRSGVRPNGQPKLKFRAWFSWRNDVLLKMCERGVMKGRVRIFMLSPSKGREQIDIVEWDEWHLSEDYMLTLDNVTVFDTAPMRP